MVTNTGFLKCNLHTLLVLIMEFKFLTYSIESSPAKRIAIKTDGHILGKESHSVVALPVSGLRPL